MTKRTALITGANKGIGLEIARGLGGRGLRVLVGARDAERGEGAAAQLRAEGLDAVFVHLDVTDGSSIAVAAQRIASEFGGLDVLVNNAGVALAEIGDHTSTMTAATARTIFETNVIGVIALTNTLMPLLRDAEAGRIVNVSSEVGSFGFMTDPEQPFSGMEVGAYGASKSALNMMTVSYAVELKGTSVKVNAMTPGYTKTDLNHNTGWRSPQESAKVAVDLALIGEDGPSGGFFQEGLEYHADTVVPW
ncbi:SDR family oxidoreductase [Glycomyces paridis]|uniref:SDR family oxidoreductase n=1 Tax=Glycomyces paridis TaxID=2126555 RepID=A0A4S8PKU7_9ACTN|nr:SDR family oxidoreductase [Glycomyces paridis]THV31370.1 SDR family oxidoreductase [Glycomyces paridis]